MGEVEVRIPSLLARLLNGNSIVCVEAETLSGALLQLVRQHPELRVHLFEENGELRRHVLCFHNDENTRWLTDLNRPIRVGDVITIMQAVSGG